MVQITAVIFSYLNVSQILLGARMTQAEMEIMIIEVVCKIQDLSGREKVAVTPWTRPVTDVPGFDSLNGVEATVDMLDRLKLELEFNNVLVDDSKALTVAEAATRLLGCMPEK